MLSLLLTNCTAPSTTTSLERLEAHDDNDETNDFESHPSLLDSLNNNIINNNLTGKCKITINDQVKDQLEALLRQECNYRCVDYITERRKEISSSNSNSIQQLDNKKRPSVFTASAISISIEGMPKPDLVHMLEEFAFLVTDTRYVVMLESPPSPTREAAAEAAQMSDSSSSSPSGGTPLKRVSSMISFKGIHEEASHQQQQQQQQQDERSQLQQQQQQQPSGEDLAYWRQQMMDWAFLVVESFEMEREVVAVAFNLLDRYVPLEMSRGSTSDKHAGSSNSGNANGGNDDTTSSTVTMMPPITRDDYQLFAMTCLYTAVKVLQPYPRKFAVEALVAMSRDFYAAQDICYTERDILKALQWRVNPPTAMIFCRHFIDALLSSSSSSAKTFMAAAASASSFPPPSSLAQGSTSPSSVRAFMQMEEEYQGAPDADQKDLHALCAKVTEMAVADPFFLSYKNSTIGLAAVLHAARLLGGRIPNAASSCKALLKALQKSKIMSTTTCTKQHQQNPAAAAVTATTLAGEEEDLVKKNQISGSELEVVYARLEKLLGS